MNRICLSKLPKAVANMPDTDHRGWKGSANRSPSASRLSFFLSLVIGWCFAFGCLSERTVASFAQSSTSVRIIKIDGSVSEGDLLELSDQSVRIKTASGDQTLPASEIGAVTWNKQLTYKPTGTALLATVDGSHLLFESLKGKGNEWTILSSSWKLASPLSPKQLVYAQLKQLDPSLEGTWRETLAENISSDGLILTRPNGELTRVGGTILEVRDAQVAFEFDDQKLEMSIEKILGMTWFQPSQPRIIPAIEVRTVDGSVWNSARLVLKSVELEVETPSKVLASIPLDKVVEIRFGTANVRWVSTSEKLGAAVDEWGNWRFASPSAPNAFLPRFVRAATSAGTDASNQDLHFPLPGSYTFRAPEGISRLESRVERSQQGDYRAELQIEVRQDSDVVFTGTLSPEQTYMDVKAAVQPEKRITLTVKSRSPSQTGTEVQWKQPRLLR